jgi:hypothetical protein
LDNNFDDRATWIGMIVRSIQKEDSFGEGILIDRHFGRIEKTYGMYLALTADSVWSKKL